MIGQPVEPGPELMLPVGLKLIDYLVVPVHVHPRTIAAATAQRFDATNPRS